VVPLQGGRPNKKLVPVSALIQREQEARKFYRKVQQRLLEVDATGEGGGIGNDTIDQEPEKPATSISRERRWK
jgi:hypothetical protein